jgi:ferric-dicitrate binding protein FerR (iron transport regulator)
MPEGNINAEVAEHLREHGKHDEPDDHRPSRRRIETIEILEAILLAVVAIATALSGYQAAVWDGESAKEYATSSRLRSESVEKHLESNQIAAYNADTLNAWLQADVAGDEELKRILEKRFTPEYEEAFRAWIALDPFNDAAAPPGPRFMPEYEDPVLEEAEELAAEASHAFDLGVDYRRTGEHYVRVTVILAAVLFLIAIGQRFKIRGVRYAVNIVAGIFLIYALYLIVNYPHIWGGA